MQSEPITIQPQVIQFNRQTTQTIKITNKTMNTLNNFFFCLFNVQKFSFKPQTFSLAPNEHKLIQITLKLKSTKSIAKQFAYLKSTDINKRLTLLINNFQSPESRPRQTEEGYSDMNTLSSRDYHELHNRALNKLAGEQQKYIAREPSGDKLFQQTENFTIVSSGKKNQYNNNYDDYMRQIQGKKAFLQKQVQDLTDQISKMTFQLQKVQRDNNFLSDQGSKFLKKINDKEAKIKQLQPLYDQKLVQNHKLLGENNQLKAKVQTFELSQERAKQHQKQRASQMYRNYESRIQELQQVVERHSDRDSINKYNKQLKKQMQEKDYQLEQVRKSLQQQQSMLGRYKANCLALEGEKRTIEEAKFKIKQQMHQMEQVNNNLREQIFVYKSRVDENSASKVQQYLEIALEGYKNENQSLKKSKTQLQKSLESIINTSRQNEDQKAYLHHKMQSFTAQITKLKSQFSLQEQQKELLRQQHHAKIRDITQRNILLLQRLAQQNNTKRQQQETRLRKQIQQKEEQMHKIKQEMSHSTERQIQTIHKLQRENEKHQRENENLQRENEKHQRENEKLQRENEKLQRENDNLQRENEKLQQKVKKYKKQTKKQLKSINEDAFEQLKRIHQQKKKLQKKVLKLEKALTHMGALSHNVVGDSNNHNYSNQNIQARTTQAKSRSQVNGQDWNHFRTKVNKEDNQASRSKSQYESSGSRKVGIHNQRPQLEDSRSASVRNVLNNDCLPQASTSNQLREFCSFVHNQQQRFQYLFNLQSQLADPLDHNGRPIANIKPLYKSIKFFKVVENRIKLLQQKIDESVIINRENEFMRQKLSQAQKRDQSKKDQSYLTIHNKQQDGTSFLVNRTIYNKQQDGTSFLANPNLTHMNVFQMIEFLKSQMKKQYNKQAQSVKFVQDKYQILKKKIYREYRSRLVQLINENSPGMNKRDKSVSSSNLIARMQNMVQRFIQGLCNLTHKQAVLNRQIKAKNSLRQENGKLKQRVNQFQHLLSQKHHGYCNRVPVKVFNCSAFLSNPNLKEDEWMQGIKLSAQLLTQKAQSQRLEQQLQIVRQDCSQLKEQLCQSMQKNQAKDGQIIKLKRSQLQLQRQYERQIERQNEILESTKNKLSGTGSKSKSRQVIKYEQKIKEGLRESESLKQQIDKKNSQIRAFKEKEKKWEQHLAQRSRLEQKQKNLSSSYRRIEEGKENNRQLRQENKELKQIVDRLEKQLEKKKLYISNLRTQEEDTRIAKPPKIQEALQQINQLQQALKAAKDQSTRLQKLKDRQILKLESDLNSAKNQALIHIKSLQSVVRAVLETIRKIFASFKIIIKRKGLKADFRKCDIVVPYSFIQVNAAEIYQQFQVILQAFDD